MQDVFFRIGGAVAGKATNSLVVNSNNTIIDHTWLWRADHGTRHVGWTINTADTGLIVNGNNVLATGLFVEHYQKNEVDLERPGRPDHLLPEREALRPAEPGRLDERLDPGLPVDQGRRHRDHLTRPGAWAATCSSRRTRRSTSSTRSRRPWTPNVRFQNMAIVSLGGVGSISHVINGTGPGVNSGTNNAYMLSYP